MKKENIDELFNYIETDNIEGVLKFVDNKELKETLLRELEQDDISEDNYKNAIYDIYDRLNGEILNYFEEKLVIFGVEEVFKDEERKKNAKKRVTNNIQQMIQGKSDSEKLALVQEALSDFEKFEIIKSIDDDFIKAEALSTLENHFYRTEIIKNFKNDDLKQQELSKIYHDDFKVQIIESFKDEKLKVNALKELEFDTYKAYIIKNLNDDELKIEALNNLEDERYKLEVIESIKDDKIKIKSLKFIKSEGDKQIVIKSIKDEELKVEALNEITRQVTRYQIIGDLKDENIKIKALSYLKNHKDRLNIILDLKDDRLKIETLSEQEDEWYKTLIIESIKEDSLKLKALKEIQNEEYKTSIIKSIDEDKLKVEALKEIQNEKYKSSIIESLKDDKLKIQELKEIQDEAYRTNIIKSLKDDNLKIQELRKLEIVPYKVIIINSIQDNNLKIEALDEFENDSYKVQVMLSFNDELKIKALRKLDNDDNRVRIILTIYGDKLKVKALGELKDEWNKVSVIKNLEDGDLKLQEISKLPKDIIPVASRNVRLNIGNIEFIKNNLKQFLEFEGIKNQVGKKQIIERLSLKNADFLRTVDFRILDEKYLNIFGEDKINLISCFPDVQESIVNLEDKQLTVFARCINTYLEERPTEDEWTVLAQEILNNIGEYNELFETLEDIDSLQNQDIFKLIYVLQNENYCEIKNISEVRNFQNTLDNKSRKVINSDIEDVDAKKNAVFWKIFGHDINYARKLINLYGDDIGNLNNGEMKDYIKAIMELDKTNDIDVLKDIFENCSFAQIDKVSIERNLKTEYGKMFNEGLYRPERISKKNEPIDLRGRTDLEAKIGIDRNIEDKPIEEYALEKTKIYNNIRIQVSLNEIIKEAKGLEELFDKAESIQSQNHSTSPVHGVQHVKNVLLLSNYIGLKNGVSHEDLELIKEAAIYHDVLHEKSGDPKHAKAGAEWYIQNVNTSLNKDEVAYLIEAHELKNEEQFSELALSRFSNIDEKRKEKLIKYAKILQDADRLDMLRYDIENPKTQRFDVARLNDLNNTELISAVIELNTKESITNGYLQVKDDKVGLSNVIEAGTDFKILMTAVGAFSGINPENYKEDWNRPALASQHFCASYIRNDMIGTAPIKNICYGFSSMKDDALVLSGSRDIYSSRTGFNSTAKHDEKYYTPDEQINNTRKYNEMDYRRIQGGEKKQPDYILVFRENGSIPNMKEAQKASKQWGGMPIVVVDIDACLESERAKVDEMLINYKENPTSELAKDIIQKVRNNRVTEASFCEELEEQLKRIKENTDIEQGDGTKKQNVKIENLRELYGNVSAEDRIKTSKRIKEIYKMIIQAKEKQNNGR